MNKHILFFQGGGDNGYEVDKTMVAFLQQHLGNNYIIHYREINSEDSKPDYGWLKEIERQINEMQDDFVLAGHSFGASMILKCLSEKTIDKRIKAVFLLAAPYWHGDEEWKAGFKLKEDFAKHLPEQLPVFFYQCLDDEEVPFSQFYKYKEKLPNASFIEIKEGGHQFNNNLSMVADDIKTIL